MITLDNLLRDTYYSFCLGNNWINYELPIHKNPLWCNIKEPDNLVTARNLLWKAHNEAKHALHKAIILQKIINVLPYLTSFYETTRDMIQSRPEFKNMLK